MKTEKLTTEEALGRAREALRDVAGTLLAQDWHDGRLSDLRNAATIAHRLARDTAAAVAREHVKMREPTVADHVAEEWIENSAARPHLAPVVAAVPLATPVGRDVANLCDLADALIDRMGEPDEIAAVRRAVVAQAHVWYFG